MRITDARALSVRGVLLIAIIMSQQSMAYADILILKNGRQIRADKFWEDAGIIKYNRLDSVVGHPEEDVEKIISERISKYEQVVPASTAEDTKKKIVNSKRISTVQNKKASPVIDLKPATRAMQFSLFGIIFIFAIFAFLKAGFKKILQRSPSKTTKKEKRSVPFGHRTFTRQKEEIEKASSYERAPGLFTNAEKDFLSVLEKVVGDQFLIQGKVRLADIISPGAELSKLESKWAFRRISQKHVDFVICDKGNYTLLGVIELDDRSHSRLDRIARDKFVNEALSVAGIPILHYPVKGNYSPSELQESINKALRLDFERTNSDRPSEGCSKKMGNEDKQFVAKEDDLRWASPEFKI